MQITRWVDERDPQFCSCREKVKQSSGAGRMCLAAAGCLVGSCDSRWAAALVLGGTASWGCCKRQGRAYVRGQMMQVNRSLSCVAQGTGCSFSASDLALLFYLYCFDIIFIPYFTDLQCCRIKLFQKHAKKTPTHSFGRSVINSGY